MAAETKILIVDDDVNIAELASLYLNKEGYATKTAYDGKKAVEAFISCAPSLVLLDIMLPVMDGYEVCREIRKMSQTPVIMLTAKGETFDKVLGLSLGADDYIVKPFEPNELVARVKAVLRRYRGNEDKSDGRNVVVYPGLTVNMDTFEAIYHGEKIALPPKEFELLYFLASNPEIVFTREQLLDKIWGYDFIGDTRTVDVHIKRLREKLDEEDVWSIGTVWGVGYKFKRSGK